MKVAEQETGAAGFGAGLRAAGVTTVFAVSGNQILSLFEGAAAAGLRVIHFRHESAAAYAAAAWADLTGEIGVVLVAGGPGFYAALVGVGVAASMEVPLLLVTGGPPTTNDRPGAFQWVDQQTIAGAICKKSVQAHGAAQVAPLVDALVKHALAAIPGPVHLTIPIDVCLGETEGTASVEPLPSNLKAEPDAADRAKLAEIAAGLAAAKKPIVIARPSAERGRAGEALRKIGKSLAITPVVMECPRGSEDMRYSGVTSRYAEGDFVLLVGPADFTVHFIAADKVARGGRRRELVGAPGDPVLKRDVDYHLQLAPAAALEIVAAELAKLKPARTPWVPPSHPADPPSSSGGALHPLAVATVLRDAIRPDDLIVLDGGEFCQWVRMALASLPNHIIWNSRLGAIGGSIGCAIGAAATGRYRRILTVIGDGSFGYHAAEFETAVREKLKLVAVVGNDERWAAEWHNQTERYGRAVATMLSDAPYGEVARGFGAKGFDLSDVASLKKALDEALSGDAPTCINVRIPVG